MYQSGVESGSSICNSNGADQVAGFLIGVTDWVCILLQQLKSRLRGAVCLIPGVADGKSTTLLTRLGTVLKIDA
jgi:hypothetical protein